MTSIGNVYGEALYSLACEEGLSKEILQELTALEQSFAQEPAFLRLLDAPNLTKEERCQVLEDCFRGNIHGYVLNFLKLLTEKSYARQFGACCAVYRNCYNEDNGILPVTAVTAVPLKESQYTALSQKLAAVTGKTIQLHNRVDEAVLGGIRLDYNGIRLDDTLAHRLGDIRTKLKDTVL
ncbi:MAG: ATP synthase F1 subunit delta [Oscillospiraceae bacterium]|nr:ATP synthase F1 subunit delta [Oscillospiraceae bacterium]